ncbi:MAG: DinB family protein [Bryobacteraceae bacterium]
MTYYGPKDMAASFRTVRKNTIQIAQEIPEDKYGFSPAPGVRTVGEALVHIALATGLQMQIHQQKLSTLAGFDFMAAFGAMTAEAAKPRTKAEVVALLTVEGEKVGAYLEGLDESFLAESVEMPHPGAPARTRFDMLASMKEHEMHHRGQLMLVERMIGITPHLTRQMQEMMAAAAANNKK